MKILFFLKRKEPLNDGSAPIYMRVTVHNSTFECSVHKSIHPCQWITAKSRARGSRARFSRRPRDNGDYGERNPR